MKKEYSLNSWNRACKFVFLLVILILVVFTVFGCFDSSIGIEKAEAEILTISIEDLSNNLSEYKEKVIRIRGYPEFIGEESRFIPFVFCDVTSKMLRISFSEVTTVAYRLYNSSSYEGPYILFFEETGGIYIPILPVVRAPCPVYSKVITIEGEVIENKEGAFFVNLFKVIEN